MTNLNPSLPEQQTPRPIPKKLSVSFLVISFVGFLDATYLTAKHFLGTPLPCSFFTGCDTVTKSVYSTIGPIPVALLGALYYLALFALAAGFFGFGARKMLILAARLTPIGLLASLWFLVLQLFIIKAICLYCMISIASSTLLFIFGLRIKKYRSHYEIP